jgi:hypothetical protein
MVHLTVSHAIPLAANVSGVTHPGLRASDEDRQRVVAELERHTAAGRLSLDEFSERVGRVYGARTHAELGQITHDLPAVPAVSTPDRRGDQRHLLFAMALALAVIAVLGVAIAIWRK